MYSKIVIESLCCYAKKFVSECDIPGVKQDVIDAVVVEFINYLARHACNIDLGLYTSDLKKKDDHPVELEDKQYILLVLQYWFKNFKNGGIATKLKQNKHMNNCGGIVCTNEIELAKVIEMFIKGYMSS